MCTRATIQHSMFVCLYKHLSYTTMWCTKFRSIHVVILLHGRLLHTCFSVPYTADDKWLLHVSTHIYACALSQYVVNIKVTGTTQGCTHAVGSSTRRQFRQQKKQSCKQLSQCDTFQNTGSMISYTDAGNKTSLVLGEGRGGEGGEGRGGKGREGKGVCVCRQGQGQNKAKEGAGPWTTAVCCTGSTTTPRI